MAKIAFGKTIGDSYNFLFLDFRRFLRIAGAWVILQSILFVLAFLIFGPASVGPRQRMLETGHIGLGTAVVALVFALFAIVSNIAFAVAWHRAVLLGEVPSEPLRTLRFRWREWRFFLYSLAVGIISVLLVWSGALLIGVVAVIGAGQSFGHISGWIFGVAGAAVFIFFVVALPFIARLTLGFPAIAIEEPKGVLGRAWRRGRHNGWRLIWGPLACSLPLSIISGIIGGVQQFVGIPAAWGGAWFAIALILELVFYAVATTATFMALAGAISFLSLSYRQLREDPLPTPAVP